MLWHKAKHLKNHMTVSAKRRTYLSVRILLHQIADIAVGKMKILLKIFKCSRRSCRDASAHQIEMLVPVGNALHAHPVGTPSGDVTLHFGAHLLHHAVEDLEKFFLGKLRAKKFNIALDELRLPCFVLFQPDEHVEVGQRSVMGRNAFRGEICGKQVSLSAGRLLESEIQIEKDRTPSDGLVLRMPEFLIEHVRIDDEGLMVINKASGERLAVKVESQGDNIYSFTFPDADVTVSCNTIIGGYCGDTSFNGGFDARWELSENGIDEDSKPTYKMTVKGTEVKSS